MPNLKYLEMRLRNPKDYLFTSSYNHFDDPSRTSGCQRGIVDMIYNSAFPFVSHLGSGVKLLGYVKKKTKDKWENIYTNKPIWYDADLEIQRLLSTKMGASGPEGYGIWSTGLCTCNAVCKMEHETFTQPRSVILDSGFFDFEDAELDNYTLNTMKGYGGTMPGAPLFSERSCERDCRCQS
ncbi:hypothetical protein BU23DRAFT_660004 [Bimuria novae-zelandiae CBS 107.79]|uniref:Uncharacterized protein n=1 Tax=Bimuria novae-zelandiae CBS 107.79 TaxID=1447943 RepID=A0A6A5VLG6_9PLEO|nr:hypothetical protein BU23DRAFT_660004 [Bimuria novae-zelandiae CBS 107.79]